MRNGCPFCDYEGPSEVTEHRGAVWSAKPLNPVTPGHRIFVPTSHVTDAATSPVVAGVVMEVAAEYVRDEEIQANIITSIGRAATQTVMHLHCHVIPRRVGDGIKLPWSP